LFIKLTTFRSDEVLNKTAYIRLAVTIGHE